MVLEFPSKLTGQESTISSKNIQHLIEATKKSKLTTHDVSTQVVLDCFKEIKNHQPGIFHYFGKYTTSTVAFLGAIALPTGIVYRLAQNYMPQSTTDYITAGASVSGLVLTDWFSGKATGIRPIKFLVSLASMVLVYGAGKFSESVISGYSKVEEDSREFEKKFHETIVENIKTTYDAIAVEIVNRFNNTNDPKKIFELKEIARELEESLPKVVKALAKLKIANPESSIILQELKSAINQVNDYQIVVKSPQEKDANKYNTNLLVKLTQQNIESIGLSTKVLHDLQEAQKHRKDISHTVKTYVVSCTAGIITAIAPPVLASAGTYLAHPPTFDSLMRVVRGDIDQTNAAYALASIVLVLGSSVLGQRVGKHYFSYYAQERATCDAKTKVHLENAKNELKAIYDGIADELANRQKNASKQAKIVLHQAAQEIFNKISGLKNVFKKRGLTDHSEVITQKLRQTLLAIISPKANTMSGG